jgi:hypothetical protein
MRVSNISCPKLQLTAMAAVSVTRVATSAGRLYRLGANASRQGMLLPGVTSVLGMVEKSGGLIPWSIRMALNVVREEIRKDTSASTESTPNEDVIQIHRDSFEAMLDKAAGAADSIKDNAADFGTRAHAAIDAIIREDAHADRLVTPDIAKVVEGFKKWYAESGLVLSSAGDTVVFSRKYGYAGAADALGFTKDRKQLVVCDFKTSNSIHDTYALQLAAYTHAVQEMLQSGELAIGGLASDGSTTAMHPSISSVALLSDDQDQAAVLEAGPSVPRAMMESEASLPAVPFSSSDALLPNTPSASPRKQPTKMHPRPLAASQTPSAAINSVIVDEYLAGNCNARRMHSASAAANPSVNSYTALPVRALVVRLDKLTGMAEVKRVQDLQGAFHAFKAALLLWHVNNHGKLLTDDN